MILSASWLSFPDSSVTTSLPGKKLDTVTVKDELQPLYDYLAGLVGAPLPDDGPAPAGIGSKRLSNACLRASGFRPQWPDAREGYAALVDPSVQRTP